MCCCQLWDFSFGVLLKAEYHAPLATPGLSLHVRLVGPRQLAAGHHAQAAQRHQVPQQLPPQRALHDAQVKWVVGSESLYCELKFTAVQKYLLAVHS